MTAAAGSFVAFVFNIQDKQRDHRHRDEEDSDLDAGEDSWGVGVIATKNSIKMQINIKRCEGNVIIIIVVIIFSFQGAQMGRAQQRVEWGQQKQIQQRGVLG